MKASRTRSLLSAALLVVVGCSGAPKRQTDVPPPCPECNATLSSETEPEETTYRSVPRAETADTPQNTGPPFEPFDPFVDDVVVAPDDLADVGVDGAVAAFRGNFVRSRGDEVVAVDAEGELTILDSRGSVITRASLGIVDPDPGPRAAKLVDERLDLVVVRRETPDASPLFSVFRVIGGVAAEVFRADLSAATVEFVHRGDERGIRVTDAEGSSEVFRWNKWEGVWRVPQPPPTAPR